MNSAMPETKTYALQLLFDSEQIASSDLESRVSQAISGQAPNIDLQIETTEMGSIVSISGSLEAIDECHHQINVALLKDNTLACVRFLDEAGDEVRSRAYPILSKIEQHLRSFVNRKAIEILGFDWWQRYAPEDLQAKVRKYAGKEAGITLLEGTQFDDLVSLVTYQYSEWKEDKPVSIGELNQIMANCSTFEEFRTALASKTARISFWDKVFAPYFDDAAQWEKIKSALGFAIHERHKVMHHRPMRLAKVKALAKKEQEIASLFQNSKPTLSKAERENVHREAEQNLRNAEEAHRTEVGQLWRAIMTNGGDSPIGRIYSAASQEWVEGMASLRRPSAIEASYLASMPTQKQMQDLAEQIHALKLLPEEIESQQALAKHILDSKQNQNLSDATTTFAAIDPEMIQHAKAAAENLGPVLAMLDQLNLQKFKL